MVNNGYLEEETEFLTNYGWKRFDAIDEKTKLAIVKPDGLISYKPVSQRIDFQYTGNIYSYENRYTRFCICSTKPLYISYMHRSPKNDFSYEYDENNANWIRIGVEEFWGNRKSHCHIPMFVYSENNEYPISDDDIILFGAYISEGSIAKNKKKKPSYISISQLEGGRICGAVESIKKYKVSKTQFHRKGRYENTYFVKHPDIQWIIDHCGEYCDGKKIPKICYEFSERQIKLFLDVLIMGDGHNHNKGHRVYYTTSKQLIDDLHSLLFCNGYCVQLYGPYQYNDELPAYQLMLSKDKRAYNYINKAKFKSNRRVTSGWKISVVENKRVVNMNNGDLLVTRNNKKIAIM